MTSSKTRHSEINLIGRKSESFGFWAAATSVLEGQTAALKLFLLQTHAAAVCALLLHLRDFYRNTFSWSQESEALLCVV